MNKNPLDTHLVKTAVRDAVLYISMDAPEAGNALSVEMSESLAAALENADTVPGVNCVVLESTGKHFCTGGNVKDMRDGKDLMAGSVAQVREKLQSTLHRLTHALHDIKVPTIAAVNGMAIGAGCDLALMCDIRIASDRAQFAESFLRIGLVSGIGGAWFLTRLVGLAKAMEMTLTSEFMSAESALEHGIVARVVPHSELAQVVTDMANKIAAAPPTALRMAKQLVRASASSELPAALELAGSIQAILLCGQEHKDAVGRFLEDSSKR